jgi:hypothetical protein
MKRTIIYLVILLATISCVKDYEIDPDPAKAILGKWVMIEMGGNPLDGHSIFEWRSDSTLLGYSDIDPNNTSMMNYYIDSLYHEYKYIYEGNETSLLQIDYKYEFYDDKLRTEMVDMMATYTTFVFKRLK